MRWLREQLPEPFWFWLPFLVAVVLSFVAMLPFEATRWNAVAELWGVVGAGAVFWFVSERHSESIQRRVWLRKHAPYVRMVLERIVDNAGWAARATLDLPDDLHQQLTHGATGEQRYVAAEKAREYVARVAEAGVVRNKDTKRLGNTLNQSITGFELAFNDHGAVLDRLTELQASLHDCMSYCRFIAWSAPALQEEFPESMFHRFVSTQLPAKAGEAALAICEKSANILVEAGELPER